VIIIGVDDTDNLGSRGTGHLARLIAADLGSDYQVLGVTRHQLLVHPQIPYTRKNSAAAILLEGTAADGLSVVAERVRKLIAENIADGSDPGLCVVEVVPPGVAAFGRRAQEQIVTQAEARTLAAEHGLLLFGLGGDNGGVIGALAAVGLASGGEDGRYVLVGRSRECSGLQPVEAVLGVGIQAIQTTGGEPVTEGLVQSDKLRPARRQGRPVLVVEQDGDFWVPVKLD
jgi:tRNA(Ile2) C34 agmatinyltransferase TiaS